MKELAKYTIAVQGLEEKTYEYQFEGNNAFFEAFPQDLIQKGHFLAKVTLDKSATMLQTRFVISGQVELICDRSLEPFDEPFSLQERHIFKYGEKAEELTDEIEVIPFGTPIINVAQLIYEFICVAIPMKKLHPRFRTDEDNEFETLVYSSEKGEVEAEEEPKIDPRWAALVKLKGLEN